LAETRVRDPAHADQYRWPVRNISVLQRRTNQSDKNAMGMAPALMDLEQVEPIKRRTERGEPAQAAGA